MEVYKFKSLFDHKYFMSGVFGSIKDGDFKTRLSLSHDSISMADYYKCMDTKEAYLGELKLHSKDKTFYKNIQGVEVLDSSHLPSVLACTTHLAIGYNDRCAVRSSPSPEAFIELLDELHGLAKEIAEKGTAKNTWNAGL